MKKNVLLSVYKERKINRISFDKYFYPSGPSETEFRHEVLNDSRKVAFEIVADIDGGIVKAVGFVKGECIYWGNESTITAEQSLTDEEWIQAVKVFDECFPEENETQEME